VKVNSLISVLADKTQNIYYQIYVPSCLLYGFFLRLDLVFPEVAPLDPDAALDD
jgi:hypothetical protein